MRYFEKILAFIAVLFLFSGANANQAVNLNAMVTVSELDQLNADLIFQNQLYVSDRIGKNAGASSGNFFKLQVLKEHQRNTILGSLFGKGEAEIQAEEAKWRASESASRANYEIEAEISRINKRRAEILNYLKSNISNEESFNLFKLASAISIGAEIECVQIRLAALPQIFSLGHNYYYDYIAELKKANPDSLKLAVLKAELSKSDGISQSKSNEERDLNHKLQGLRGQQREISASVFIDKNKCVAVF